VTRRVYLVGTDTEVGKTALTCALLRAARAADTRTVLPFKPAQSGATGPTSDAGRLLVAAGRPFSDVSRMCPLSYPDPVAPGIADDPSAFFRPRAANVGPHNPTLDTVAADLAAWQQDADLVLIEGAGGLHVPMPGGSWQPAWIERLSEAAVVVGRAHLGTINHTLLTVDALRTLGVPVLGFYLVATDDRDDPAADDNPAVIAAARGVPHLGTLPFLAQPDGDAPFDLLSPLLDALDAR
jgi:dethiobiotin synthetase